MAATKKPVATAAGLLPLAIALIGTAIQGPPGTVPAPAVVRSARLAIYPDSTMTPGVTNPDITQENIAENICSKTWSTSTIRPSAEYTDQLKKKQLPDYGEVTSDESAACELGSANTKCYEEDHLISLENGGNPKDPGNLWPEPYNTFINGQIVGARQKDEVEGFIHDEICFAVPDNKHNAHMPAHISIPLGRGQDILAHDWYSCYVSMLGGGDCK